MSHTASRGISASSEAWHACVSVPTGKAGKG